MVIAQSYDWIVPELKEFRILCMIPSRIPEDLRAKMLWLDARIRFSGIAGCGFQKSKLEEFLPEVDALMNEINARALLSTPLE